MTRIPADYVAYKQTSVFTETSVPAALLKDHSTKEGTWGLIHIEEGALKYYVTDARREPSERVLSPETEPGVVEPTILHRVEPLGPVRFWVEFWRSEAQSGQ